MFVSAVAGVDASVQRGTRAGPCGAGSTPAPHDLHLAQPLGVAARKLNSCGCGEQTFRVAACQGILPVCRFPHRDGFPLKSVGDVAFLGQQPGYDQVHEVNRGDRHRDLFDVDNETGRVRCRCR